jgi:hypothetical protein
MNQPSNTVRALEARIRALELEYARLNERLRTVGAALGGAASSSAQDVTSPEARMPVPQPVREIGKRAESASRTALPSRRPQTEASPPAAAQTTGPKEAAASPSAKKTMRGAQPDGPRKWFEKGEAVALFRTILKRPMPTRDLMVRVVAAKRKAQLPKEDLERFKWAVHSALKEAISANAIVRQDDGMIAVTPANVRVAGKISSKARK